MASPSTRSASSVRAARARALARSFCACCSAILRRRLVLEQILRHRDVLLGESRSLWLSSDRHSRGDVAAAERAERLSLRDGVAELHLEVHDLTGQAAPARAPHDPRRTALCRRRRAPVEADPPMVSTLMTSSISESTTMISLVRAGGRRSRIRLQAAAVAARSSPPLPDQGGAGERHRVPRMS